MAGDVLFGGVDVGGRMEVKGLGQVAEGQSGAHKNVGPDFAGRG